MLSLDHRRSLFLYISKPSEFCIMSGGCKFLTFSVVSFLLTSSPSLRSSSGDMVSAALVPLIKIETIFRNLAVLTKIHNSRHFQILKLTIIIITLLYLLLAPTGLLDLTFSIHEIHTLSLYQFSPC